MKPDWDELGESFENSKKVIIGDVDCTSDGGKKLCETHGVQGYPTIKYFEPPNREGVSYEGDRSLKELKKFAKTLGPACTADTLDKCTKKQKEELQPLMDMDPAARAAEIAELKAKVDASQKAHDALLETLQKQFKESEESNKKIQDELKPRIKLLTAATPVSPAAAKDEV